MTTPQQKYQEAKEGLQRAVEDGEVNSADQDAILELVSAYDEDDMSTPLPSKGKHPEDTKHKKPNTLKYWCVYLKRIAERMDVSLTEATAGDINSLMTGMKKGTHDSVKDEGLANNSVRNYQGVARRFYRYHDFGVDPDDIAMITGDDTHVDERDMLTPEEISRIRDSADHPRDLAIFDLLLYTGQRNTAIRSLRIRDIDLEEGVYYLNEEAEGLKGADKNGKKRPLLGAVGALREWLRYHPHSDNPDAYLITAKPRYRNVDPDDMISRNTLLYAMKKLKEEANIDKPMNPHNIRHNFVTIAKREYDLSDATIKWLIGHSPDSQVMETTYAHLSDEDRIKEAEIGAGIRDPDEEEKSLSPDICHCGEPLPPDARACPRCGTIYAPDAQEVKKQVNQDLWDSKSEAEGDKEEAVDELKRILDENPELIELLADRAE